MSAAKVSIRRAFAARPRDDAERFDLALARELVQFAVDLDAQDDRLRLQQQLQEASTNAASRANLMRASSTYLPQYGDRWAMHIDTRIQFADGHKRSTISEPSWDGANPNCNGFGPFANAWVLAKDTKSVGTSAAPEMPAYVVAVRGTVFSSRPSVVEDVFANTIAARSVVRGTAGAELPLVFAQLPGAEIHAGFAYACLSLLFDRNFGLIHALQTLKEQRVALTLTGHSQGAAMATLLHAFLRYASKENCLLSGKIAQLDSYVFAQPKPGNALFSADFEQVCGSDGSSFVVNNTLDPVPAVPLTRQSLSDLSKDLPPASRIDKIIDAVEEPARCLRRWVSSQLDRQIIRWIGSDDLLLDPQRQVSCPVKACMFPAGSSRNYTMAGTLISLAGDASGAYQGQNSKDPFIQHHAPTYRELLGRV